jgi:hypothetical protein
VMHSALCRNAWKEMYSSMECSTPQGKAPVSNSGTPERNMFHLEGGGLTHLLVEQEEDGPLATTPGCMATFGR